MRIRQLGNHRSWLLPVIVFILVQVLSLRNFKNLNVYIMFFDTDVNKHLLNSISLIIQFDFYGGRSAVRIVASYVKIIYKIKKLL
jgi:hypothetical protein